MKKKLTKKENFNIQLNRAIATTVVVTAIGISTTISSLPVRASVRPERNRNQETYFVGNEVSVELDNDENLDELTIEDLVVSLLKEGKYKEAREIRRTFSRYENPLKKELRELHNYAVSLN